MSVVRPRGDPAGGVDTANLAIVGYHHALPITAVFGSGTLSSSDGQRFWGEGPALLVAGAVFGGAFVRPRPHGWLRRLTVVTGLLVGASLLVRGVGVELVLLLDAGGIAASVGPAQTRWSLLLWNPWFVLGGVAFLFATYRFARVRRPELPVP